MATVDFVSKALDSAIHKVAESEFDRLTKGLKNPALWGMSLHNGLQSLDKLRRGISPNYDDDWTALLYLTWYQVKQINLAYSAIKKLLEIRGSDKLILNDSGRLHLVDFRCGALAMQFAVALAVADAVEQGQFISEVMIDSLDRSQTMISLGEKVWEQFKIAVREDSALDNLVNACGLIEPHTNTSLAISRCFDGDKWLTAIHAVYQSSHPTVKSYLSQISSRINPDVSVITTFDSWSGKQLIEAIKPFKTEECYIDSKWIEPRITGIARKITQSRQVLRNQMPAHILQKPIGNRTVYFYLSSNVDWKWRPEVCLVYDRIEAGRLAAQQEQERRESQRIEEQKAAEEHSRRLEYKRLAPKRAEERQRREREGRWHHHKSELQRSQRVLEKRRHRDKLWDSLSSYLDSREVISATVTGTNSGGLLVKWEGLKGFVPFSQCRDIAVRDGKSSARLEGRSFDFNVLEVNREEGNFKLTRVHIVNRTALNNLSIHRIPREAVVDSSKGKVHPESSKISVGDRVRIKGFGEGTVRKLKKNRANVLLDKGWPWEGQVSEVKLV